MYIAIELAEYEGDVDFPEAVHYDDYVAERIRVLYHGAKVTVRTIAGRQGHHVQVVGTDDDTNHERVLGYHLKRLWLDFVEHGHKMYG